MAAVRWQRGAAAVRERIRALWRKKAVRRGLLAAVVALVCLGLLWGVVRAIPGTPIDTTFTGRVPVVIDSDGGLDDLTALLLARQVDRLEVRGLTASYGAVSLPQAGRNLLAAAEWMGEDWPVALGAKSALDGSLPAGIRTLGENGLYGTVLPPTARQTDPRAASDFLYDLAVEEGGQLQVICLGPATNLARAIEEHPDLPGLLAGVTLGSTRTPIPEVEVERLKSESEEAWRKRWEEAQLKHEQEEVGAHPDLLWEADGAALEAVVESGIPLTVVPVSALEGMEAGKKDRWDTLTPLLEDTGKAAPLYAGAKEYLNEEYRKGSPSIAMDFSAVAVLAALVDESAFTVEEGGIAWARYGPVVEPGGEGIRCRVASELEMVTDEDYKWAKVTEGTEGTKAMETQRIPIPKLFLVMEKAFRHW